MVKYALLKVDKPMYYVSAVARHDSETNITQLSGITYKGLVDDWTDMKYGFISSGRKSNQITIGDQIKKLDNYKLMMTVIRQNVQEDDYQRLKSIPRSRSLNCNLSYDEFVILFKEIRESYHISNNGLSDKQIRLMIG